MPIKDVGPKSLQKEEWNEYMTATNKKGMFRIESKKQKKEKKKEKKENPKENQTVTCVLQTGPAPRRRGHDQASLCASKMEAMMAARRPGLAGT